MAFFRRSRRSGSFGNDHAHTVEYGSALKMDPNRVCSTAMGMGTEKLGPRLDLF